MGLELVRGACPGPLEMGALTVNGSRRKAAYGWPMGYGITDNGERVPDTFNGTGYISMYCCLVICMADLRTRRDLHNRN